MNKLFKKIGCFAVAGFSLFALAGCGRIHGEEQDDLNISIWDGITVTSVEELKDKVFNDGVWVEQTLIDGVYNCTLSQGEAVYLIPQKKFSKQYKD